MISSGPIGPLVQSFFVEHLPLHKGASLATVSAYRDTFRLLLHFLHQTTGKQPSSLQMADLHMPAILAFLQHLEEQRRNSVRTRNARLAAVRTFFRYVALREPECLGLATRVLAIPSKRTDRPLVGYLTRQEIEALLTAPDRATWAGRRDHALLLTMYNSGARVSELCSLQRRQVHFGATAAYLDLHGKGRKERSVPLWSKTTKILREWLREWGDAPDVCMFPNARRRSLTRHGVKYILDHAVRHAANSCVSLADKTVSPHVIRHSTAMHLLQSGVDITVIALWLGHESIETTHIYVEADLAMKEKALQKLAPIGTDVRRYKADDSLIAFLSGL
ncbi:MAG: tyrosine-type recombinase/integrase [Proteobacteria bacterium]|jgi:integrase/recombinase XerD|nr:tyrosine-type recombinase/integrase [Pseudomonadota bacterium]